MTQEELQNAFDDFNEKFWDGKIDFKVRVIPNRKTFKGQTWLDRGIIDICDGREDWIPTLLHEMCHAYTDEAHTPKWRAEVERIEKLTGYDLNKHPYSSH